MIKLKKIEEPKVLKENFLKWTSAVVEKLKKGLKPTKLELSRYSHPDVKTALLEETNGKCAYCESKIRHIAYGDIEHVVPKSAHPERRFQWKNLTLACDICNTRKAEHQVEYDTFIDPYDVDPEDFLWHFGAMIYARPGSDASIKTEKLLGLNRIELVERRSERLDSLMKLLEVIERVADPKVKNVLLADFMEETTDDKEYAALARTVARQTLDRLRSA